MKRNSLASLVEIKEKIDLCNTGRIRNPTAEKDTFRQNHSVGFIQWKPIYSFTSNGVLTFD